MARTEAVIKLPASASNVDPPIQSIVVGDVSSGGSDVTPTGGYLITAINCSTAGVLYLKDVNDDTNPEYMNLGWNPCTACKTIVHSSSNVAVPIKAKLARLTY